MILTDENGKKYLAENVRIDGQIYHYFTLNLIPEKKPVDLSVLIGSGIYCTVARFAWHRPINSDVKMTWMLGRKVKPRMNYIFHAENFEDGEAERLVNRLREAGFSVDLYHTSTYITGFSITGLQDGYCWPWEIEE